MCKASCRIYLENLSYKALIFSPLLLIVSWAGVIFGACHPYALIASFFIWIYVLGLIGPIKFITVCMIMPLPLRKKVMMPVMV